MAHHTWGIDFGDGTLRAVRLLEVAGGYEVVRAVQIPYFDPFLLKRPRSSPLGRRAFTALKQFVQQERIERGDDVVLGYPTFQGFECTLNPPRVGEKDLARIVDFEIKELTSLELDRLDIGFRLEESRSPDTYRVQARVAVKAEVEILLAQLNVLNLAWDQINLAAGALVPLVRSAYSAQADYVVLSPGLAATDVVIIQRSRYWTRTLPVGLPMPPGEAADMARDTMEALAVRLVREVSAFKKVLPLSKGFEACKILVSGEGAQVPSLVNSLDRHVKEPVEILRPAASLVFDPTRHQLPDTVTVASMGRAIGLALARIDSQEIQVPLIKQLKGRQVAKAVGALQLIFVLFFILAAGFKGLELYRTHDLGALQARLDQLVPAERLAEMESIGAQILTHEDELERLADTAWESVVARAPGLVMSLFEAESKRGTYGDYHLVELALDNSTPEMGTLTTVVATRLTDEEGALSELQGLFKPFLKNSKVSGPYPSGETETPQNQSPLVHYEVAGSLKRKR